MNWSYILCRSRTTTPDTFYDTDTAGSSWRAALDGADTDAGIGSILIADCVLGFPMTR